MGGSIISLFSLFYHIVIYSNDGTRAEGQFEEPHFELENFLMSLHEQWLHKRMVLVYPETNRTGMPIFILLLSGFIFHIFSSQANKIGYQTKLSNQPLIIIIQNRSQKSRLEKTSFPQR